MSIFRLVGDNVDHEIHARSQSKEHGNRSLHWTHQFAVLNRVQDPLLDDQNQQKPVGEIQYVELLPNSHVQEMLLHNWSVLVSRVVTKYLKPFQHLANACIYHINHEYNKEMAEKSNLVSFVKHIFNSLLLSSTLHSQCESQLHEMDWSNLDNGGHATTKHANCDIV